MRHPPRILGLMHVVPGDLMLEHLEWDQLHHIDVDRLAPGESVGRSFCVSDLVNVPCSDTTWPPGYVRIKSSTEIQVGPRDGPWAEMGPFRLYTYAERVVPQELELPAGYGPRH